MRISIIIPSYNQEQYLKYALESAVLNNPYEIIVIDDGSTDNSLKIAKDFEKDLINNHKKHKICENVPQDAWGWMCEYPDFMVVSQVNKGLASARNTGIMNATGDYILPLDADDILLPDCLSKIEAKINETDADIIGLSFTTFGTSNQNVILQDGATVEDFKTGNRLGYCSAIRRDSLLEIGGYNPKMVKGWEDLDIWFDLLKRGKKVSVIKEPVWLYQTKANSMYTESVKHSEELWGQIHRNHPELFTN